MQSTQAQDAYRHSQSFTTLHIDQILTPQAQRASENEIIRLSTSIRKYGILTPISVKKAQESTFYAPQYTVIDGRKRLLAAKAAGLERIPCQILQESNADCAIEGMIRNLRLAKLHFFEKAAAYQLLLQDFNLTQAEIAEKLELSQSTIANRLRLLAFSKEEQLEIIDFGLTERHARALLRLKSADHRAALLQEIRKLRLSVAQTEAKISQMLQETPKEPLRSLTEGQKGAPKPCKFALQSLTPLYNSIERTLDIFRKTGIAAHCTHEESEQGISITISIPALTPPQKH